MSLDAFSPARLRQLLPKALTRLNIPSEMVSKRPFRVYMEEEHDIGETGNSWKRAAGSEVSSIAMERNSSSSSSDRASLETISATEHAERAAVDLGKDVTDVFGQEALLKKSAENSGILTIPSVGQPISFGVVVPGVYRCSYPKTEDYGFIRGLHLKTIVTLVDKDLPEGYKSFIMNAGIRHHVFSMQGTKKEEIPVRLMKSILRLVLDQQNHPLLIHCNHGKHRTGCVVAIVRMVSGWELQDIVDEYRSYAEPKVRECDVDYISRFRLASLSNLFTETTALGFRVPNFFRATFFTIFVLAVWMISGSQMAVPSSGLQKREDASS